MLNHSTPRLCNYLNSSVAKVIALDTDQQNPNLHINMRAKYERHAPRRFLEMWSIKVAFNQPTWREATLLSLKKSLPKITTNHGDVFGGIEVFNTAGVFGVYIGEKHSFHQHPYAEVLLSARFAKFDADFLDHYCVKFLGERTTVCTSLPQKYWHEFVQVMFLLDLVLNHKEQYAQEWLHDVGSQIKASAPTPSHADIHVPAVGHYRFNNANLRPIGGIPRAVYKWWASQENPQSATALSLLRWLTRAGYELPDLLCRWFTFRVLNKPLDSYELGVLSKLVVTLSGGDTRYALPNIPASAEG